MSASGETLYRVYEAMVAGVLPLASGGVAEQQIAYRAQSILGTSKIHYHRTVVDDQIYYLAVPSAVMASYPSFTTALACALPGGSADQGDGCYLLALDQYAAVLIRDKGIVRLIASYSEEVLAAINSYGLPVIDLEAVTGLPLVSDAQYRQVLSSRVARMVGVVSMVAIIGSGAAFAAAKAVSGYYTPQVEISARALAAEVNALVGSVELGGSLVEQFEQMTALSAAVVGAGGWIEGYEYSARDGERFVLTLPDWVSGDVIKQFGPGVQTLVSDDPGLIWAVKRDRAGRSVEGKGPEPIASVAAIGGAVGSAVPHASSSSPMGLAISGGRR